MSAPGEFFDRSVALQLKTRVGDPDEWTDLLDTIGAATRMLEADGFCGEEVGERCSSAWEQLLTPVTFSRRVTIPTDQPMDVEAVVDLNSLLTGEQMFLQEAHRLTLGELFEERDGDDASLHGTNEEDEEKPLIEPVTDGELLLELRAVENEVRHATDDLSRLQGCASFVGPLTANDFVPIHGQALLSDFFQVCEWPNEAELQMLTEACELEDDWNTEEWFEAKREESKSSTSAVEVLQVRQRRFAQALALFNADFIAFEDGYATANLSVDNLVAHCTAAGYIKGPANAALPTASQGALTMAVQPTITPSAPAPQHATSSYSVFADATPLSPTSLNLFGALQAELTQSSPALATFQTAGPAFSQPLPVGQKALIAATEAVEAAGAVYPYDQLFDPTSQFDVSFNPNAANGLADGGEFDAFDPAAVGGLATVEDMMTLDWSQFVNED
ncbi:hypothetical protein LTR08_004017 [Meristemomyces frigidus]|nr:hypothetical protein LTR08_004017 [Meristemomyces frigidus]